MTLAILGGPLDGLRCSYSGDTGLYVRVLGGKNIHAYTMFGGPNAWHYMGIVDPSSIGALSVVDYNPANAIHWSNEHRGP